MKDWTKILFKNLSLVGLVFGSILFFLAVNQYLLTLKLNQINVLHEGIQTCFYRTYQTFTARLLNLSGSEYLRSSFVSNTEACYGDVIEETRAEFAEPLKVVIQEMNELAGEVHWFHKSLSGNKSFGKKTDSSSSTNRRFEGIEESKDGLLSKLETFRKTNIAKLELFRNFFFVLTLALFLAIVLDLIQRKQHSKLKALLNKRALEESKNMEFPRTVLIEEIIQKALKVNNQQEVGDLFNKYHEFILDGKLDIFKLEASQEVASDPDPLPEPELPKITLSPREYIAENKQPEQVKEPVVSVEEPVREKVVEEPVREEEVVIEVDDDKTEIEPAIYPSVSLDHILGNVISVHSNRLFKEGILCDVDLSEGLQIQGRPDESTQVLYNLLNQAIAAVSDNEQDKRIVIAGANEEDKVSLEIFYNAQAPNYDDDPDAYADYEISKQLVQDVGGELRSFPKLNKLGLNEGTMLQMTFRSFQDPMAGKSKSIKKVLKGTKKEILKQLSQSIV